MTMLSSATYNLINLLLKFLIFSKSSPSLMNSVTRKLKHKLLEYFLIAKKTYTDKYSLCLANALDSSQ